MTKSKITKISKVTSRKKYYVILNRANNHLVGCFPRNSEGKKAAKLYKLKLEKESEDKFVIR